MNRPKLNPQKIATLPTMNEILNQKHGADGTPQREEFNAKAKAWYFAELLKEERKAQNITQQQLAQKIGKKQSYISKIEKGEICMQLDTFFLISQALGVRFSLLNAQ